MRVPQADQSLLPSKEFHIILFMIWSIKWQMQSIYECKVNTFFLAFCVLRSYYLSTLGIVVVLSDRSQRKI